MKSKSNRRQISVRLLTWHRIRALANAEEHDCFMGEMITKIVDDWCWRHAWRFTEAHRPGWPDKFTAICGEEKSLDAPAPAR